LERPRREEVFVRVMEGVGVLGEFSLVGVEGRVGVCEREEEGDGAAEAVFKWHVDVGALNRG